jgi:hypothetical protein
MFVYLVPWLYLDLGSLLALTGVYSLPLVPLNNTYNDFSSLLAAAWISIVVSCVGLVGWTFVNREWRRLRATGSSAPATV